MKILGLRVREVGNFQLPVALDGLTGGLDVLAGPNEFGKSTLFRALEAAFTVAHSSKAAATRDWMVPASGGAPTIEVDFEAGGAGYRLRKRYFTGARALLQRLDGSQTLRGGDAEDELARLLGEAGGSERLGLLWVGQRKSLEPLKLADSARDGLKGLIADELTSAVGGSVIDAVRRKVAEQLAGLVTLRQRKPAGPHKEASDLAARLTRDAEAQREAVVRGKERLDRLGDLRGQHAVLAGASVRRERSDRVAVARTVLESARAATDKRKAAEELFRRLEREQAAAARDLGVFEQATDDAARIGARRATSARAQAAQTAKAAVLAERLAMARNALDAALAAERGQSARQAAAEATVLRLKLADAEAMAQRIAELATSSKAMVRLAPLRAKAEAEQRAIETLENRLSATSVRIRIEYDKGGHGKIARDRVGLPDNAEFAVQAETELNIAGVGTVTIAPGAVNGIAATAAQLSSAKARLAAYLAEAGVSDLPTLARLTEEQTGCLAEHDRLAARLDGLCPEGISVLRSLVAKAERPAPADLVSVLPDEGGDAVVTEARLQSIADAVRAATTAREQCQAALADLQVEQQSLDLSCAALQAEAAMLAERQAALSAVGTSAEHQATLVTAVQAATARAREAALTLQALREKEPDTQKLGALEAELTGAITAQTQADGEANRLEKDMAGLESLLERDALDGIAERLVETEEALAVANRALDRIKTEIAALDMLEERLAAAEHGAREAYLAPVTARLAPYLGLVLPGAELTLGAAFDAAGLRRDGRDEAVVRLSDGTREQIAVLVRLGLGRLLADRKKPMPLILDDALVYSDDERIAASFAALEAASRQHQVIVFTCRAKAFESLGGARLMLQPWRISED